MRRGAAVLWLGAASTTSLLPRHESGAKGPVLQVGTHEESELSGWEVTVSVTERRDMVMLIRRCFVSGSRVAPTEVEQTQPWVSPLCPWEAEKEASFAVELGCCGNS